MRKSLLIAFLTAIMVGGFALAGTVHFGTVQASTDVIGIIGSDTTWMKANSPYSLTGPVAVGSGVTLTIEAGATVNLNSYYIMVNGTLRAQGSSADPIHFNGGQITFVQFSTDWNEPTGTGCIIENAVISSTIDFNNSPKINNNTITGGISVKTSGTPVISNNTIICNSATGINVWQQRSNALILNNIISGCSTGILLYTSGGAPIISGNLIMGNTQGIRIYCPEPSTSPIIRNNTIINNSNGFSITQGILQYSAPSFIILNNNIYSNQHNVNLGAVSGIPGVPANINATYNWWGTNDVQSINQTIFDNKNDFNLGTVNFVPFLTEPNPAAPTIPTFTITASDGANGAISPSGSVVVNYGGSQTFTVTPNTGYHIADILVDGSSVGAASSHTFTNVQAAHTITASFAINTFTITVTQGANGVIAPGTTTVNYGGSQSFTITASTGYHTVDVTVDGSSVGAASSCTFSNVQAAHTISATFEPTPTPTPTPSPPAIPSPSPSQSPSPTATPSPSPTATASPSPTPTPEPTSGIFLSLPLVYAIAIAFVILIVVMAALIIKSRH